MSIPNLLDLPKGGQRLCSLYLYSFECVEGLGGHSIQHPCGPCCLGCPNATKRINQTRLTTGYLLAVCAVAGCATGSTRPKRCPTAGRASRPLPSFPRSR